MPIEIVLMAKCDNCNRTRKVAKLEMRHTWGGRFTLKICTYCVVEINNSLLVPPDRKPKPKAEKQR